jgi:nitroreductase
MNHKELKDKIIISQHCQRNFDLSKEMPKEDVETILFSVANCPSKQNLAFYDVVAIQDRETIEQIHEATLDRKGVRTNPQVLGNLLLVFTDRDPLSNFLDKDGNVKKEERGLNGKKNKPLIRNAEMREFANGENKEWAESCFKTDANIALGIAAGYCNLVSSQLGYRTGCSSCFDTDKVTDILKARGVPGKPLLLMGVGYNDETRNRREHHTTGKLIESNVKVPINIEIIE